MTKIVLNGETCDVAADCTISQMLATAGFAERKVAVEVNREIVPKSLHGDRRLCEGDRVEIVHALGGG